MPNKIHGVERALLEIFEARQKRNSRYSLRAFARDLNSSAGRLSVLLSGKKPIGGRLVKKLLASSSLSIDEKNKLISAFIEKKGGFEGVNGFYRQLNAQESIDLASWQIHAIMALLRVKGVPADPKWIASRMNIPLAEVNAALESLLKHGVIQQEGSSYKVCVAGLYYYSEKDKPSPLAENYKQYLIESFPKMKHTPDHCFGTLTFSMDRAQVEKVRKYMRQLIGRVNQLSEDGPREEVYNLSVILQPINNNLEVGSQ